MEDSTSTDNVASWGGGEAGFGWSDDGHYIPSSELPDGLTYLSVGQPFEYILGQSDTGKPRATNIKIIGNYVRCGRIVYACDEYYIIKDKALPNYIYMKSEETFSNGLYVTYYMESMDELTLTGDVLESLNISESELKVSNIATNVVKSVVTKQSKRGKVTFWNNSKKYGFISEDGTSLSIYVHINDLQAGLTTLHKFQQVEFTKHKNEKGFYAKSVTSSDSHLQGTCKSWNDDKKCGTIESNGERYYVHNSNIIMSGYRKLTINQEVYFQAYTNGKNKTEAINVNLI